MWGSLVQWLWGRSDGPTPVAFAQLLAGDKAAIEVARWQKWWVFADGVQSVSNALRSDGFCFLSYDAALTARAVALGDALQSFFAQDSAAKAGAPCYSAVLGLKEDGTDGAVFKEKISLVSGTRLQKELPPVAGLDAFVRDTDAWLAQVVRVLRESSLFAKGNLKTFQAAPQPIPLGREAFVGVSGRSDTASLSGWTGG